MGWSAIDPKEKDLSSKHSKSIKNKKGEYLDASSNMRHYGNMRFAELTLFTLLTAGLLAIFVSATNPYKLPMDIPLRLSGLILSLVFLVLQERSSKQFEHYLQRAKALEKSLGYRQHLRCPPPGLFGYRFLTTQNAARTLYLSAAAFWGASLYLALYRFLQVILAL